MPTLEETIEILRARISSLTTELQQQREDRAYWRQLAIASHATVAEQCEAHKQEALALASALSAARTEIMQLKDQLATVTQ